MKKHHQRIHHQILIRNSADKKNREKHSLAAAFMAVIVLGSLVYFGLSFGGENKVGKAIGNEGDLVGEATSTVGAQYELAPSQIEQLMKNLVVAKNPPANLGTGLYESSYDGQAVYLKFEDNKPVQIIEKDFQDDWRDLTDNDFWTPNDKVNLNTNLYTLSEWGIYSQGMKSQTFQDVKSLADINAKRQQYKPNLISIRIICLQMFKTNWV